MEFKVDMRKQRRPENIRESVIGPQGAGPCARVKKDTIRESRSSKWTGPISHGTLGSHVILGVMLEDLSIVQVRGKRKGKSNKRNIVF